MTLEMKIKDDKVRVSFNDSNRIDTTNLKLISEQLIPIVKQFENNLVNELIFDFHNIDFIDSSGLSMIINVYKKLSANEKFFKIINVNEFISNIFDITKLNTFVDIKTV